MDLNATVPAPWSSVPAAQPALGLLYGVVNMLVHAHITDLPDLGDYELGELRQHYDYVIGEAWRRITLTCTIWHVLACVRMSVCVCACVCICGRVHACVSACVRPYMRAMGLVSCAESRSETKKESREKSEPSVTRKK